MQCNIEAEAAGEIWHWSLSGVKGLRDELSPLTGWIALVQELTCLRVVNYHNFYSCASSSGMEQGVSIVSLNGKNPLFSQAQLSLRMTQVVQQHQSLLLLTFTRVLARPKRQGAAPCHFIQRPVIFPQRPVIFREPFGFFGFSSALFWAWSCRKRPIKAKGGAILCITLLFASDIAAILDLWWILICAN